MGLIPLAPAFEGPPLYFCIVARGGGYPGQRKNLLGMPVLFHGERELDGRELEGLAGGRGCGGRDDDRGIAGWRDDRRGWSN